MEKALSDTPNGMIEIVQSGMPHNVLLNNVSSARKYARNVRCSTKIPRLLIGVACCFNASPLSEAFVGAKSASIPHHNLFSLTRDHKRILRGGSLASWNNEKTTTKREVARSTSNGISRNGMNDESNDDLEELFDSSTTARAFTRRHKFSFTPAPIDGKRLDDLSSGDIDEYIPTEYVAETNLPTDLGHYRLRAYRIPEYARHKNQHVGNEPCVIYCTDLPPGRVRNGDGDGRKRAVPVRIHDQCFTSEVFRSKRCDCKEQLQMSLKYIQENGGAVIYLQQEGRGIGLANKIAAYALQDGGMDTVDANIHLGFPEDCRQYGVVPSILRDLGIDSIRLMTNNPYKIERLRALGVEVEGTIPMVVENANPHNRRYLETKVSRMNHTDLGNMLDSSQTMKGHQDTLMNGIMVPRRSIPESMQSLQMIVEKVPTVNEGSTMACNAVTQALLDDMTESGVKMKEDGYCFGKQSVLDAIAATKRGEIVVVVDDENRENEGDFIVASDKITPQLMATIVRHTSGVICVALEDDRLKALELPSMVEKNEDPKGTAFTVTVDAAKKHGITTGISAADRAKTIQLLADPSATASDFVRPGHIFPLRAREGGTLARDGHTEAAVDLAKLAGLNASGVLCEIVSEENPVEMARLPELKRFCKKHGFVMTSIVDIAQYRREMEGW